MTGIEVRGPQSDREIVAVEALVDAAAAATGRDLDRGLLARGGAGVAAWEPGDGDPDVPVAYAQVAWGDRRWELELALDPRRRGEAPDLGVPVLAATLDTVRAGGGGQTYLWVSRPTEADDRMARMAGLEPERDLWQLVRPLPVEPEVAAAGRGPGGRAIETRPFVPGRDERAWVEVNNRAFAWHPEQGGWTVDDVREREREPWFDPEGFLLHERDGRLAGFCWTKVHDHHDPPLGEIYVIAVDPDVAGLGLGQSLVLAGLDHLAARGLTVGMLYVDASNLPAVRLYDRLGFTLDHVERAYAGHVPPT